MNLYNLVLRMVDQLISYQIANVPPSSHCATFLSCTVNCRCSCCHPVHRIPLSHCAPPPRCRRRRHSLCADATVLPALRCAPLLHCCHCRVAVKLPPPPLPLLLLRRSLVGCCIVVRHPILSLHAVMQPSMLSLLA